MRHAGRRAEPGGAVRQASMTAVYADFLSNGLKWNRFSAGSGRRIAKGQRFLLTRFLRSPVFGDNGAMAGSWNRLPQNWLWVDYRGW